MNLWRSIPPAILQMNLRIQAKRKTKRQVIESAAEKRLTDGRTRMSQYSTNPKQKT